MKQAVIFLGGRGARLKPLTNTLPKPMVLINNKPFLDYLIYFLIKKGFNNFIFLCGYQSNKIVDRYKNSKLSITFIIGKQTDNPEKRLIAAKKYLRKNFLLLYGDNFLNINKDFDNYKKFILEKTPYCTMISFSNKFGSGEYGKVNNINYNKDKLVTNYYKSKFFKSIDIGFFSMSRNDIKKNKKRFSFKKLIKDLIRNKRLYTYVTNTQYYYITNSKSLYQFEKYVIRNKIRPLPERFLNK